MQEIGKHMKHKKYFITIGIFFFLVFDLFGAGEVYFNKHDYKSLSFVSLRPVRSKFSTGVMGGYNFSKIRFDGTYYFGDENTIGEYSVVTSQLLMGFNVGISTVYQKNDDWSFQLDLQINQSGMRVTDSYDKIYYFPNGGPADKITREIDADIKLNYLSFPIVVKRHFGRVLKWYIEAGAAFQYLKNSRMEGNVDNTEYDYWTSSYTFYNTPFKFYTSSVYNHDLSLVGGMGLIFPIEKGVRGPIFSLVLNARYYHGLLNVYAGEAADPLSSLITIDPNNEVEDPVHPNNGQVLKNSALSLRVGFVFAI